MNVVTMWAVFGRSGVEIVAVKADRGNTQSVFVAVKVDVLVTDFVGVGERDWVSVRCETVDDNV